MTIYQTRNIGHPLINLVRLKGFPILRQLQLEERLLRNSSDNWCIINDGTDNPAIVMGVSGYLLYMHFYFEIIHCHYKLECGLQFNQVSFSFWCSLSKFFFFSIRLFMVRTNWVSFRTYLLKVHG